MHNRATTLLVIAWTLVALAAAYWQQQGTNCDLTPITFGCSAAVGNETLIGIASDLSSVLPLEVIQEANVSTGVTLTRWASVNAPRASLVLGAKGVESIIETNAESRELVIRSPGSSLVLVQDNGTTRLTIDSATGCILVNGSLPPASPCRLSVPPASAPSPSSPPPIGSLSFNTPIIALWLVIVVSIASLFVGCIIGCLIGFCAMRRRLRPVRAQGAASYDSL